MSAALTAGIAGTGFSIINGLSSGKSADRANAQAMEAYAKNQAVAETLRERQQALVDTPLKQKIAEYQGAKVTPEGQQALNQFNDTMGTMDRQIQEQAPLAGEGVTGGRALTNQFRRAQGIAGINLQDSVNKSRGLQGYMQMAQQTPGWAQIATGANTQMGAFQQGQAQQALGEEQSSYAAAAAGLRGLADMYSKGYRFGARPGAATTDYSGLMDTPAQIGYERD